MFCLKLLYFLRATFRALLENKNSIRGFLNSELSQNYHIVWHDRNLMNKVL